MNAVHSSSDAHAAPHQPRCYSIAAIRAAKLHDILCSGLSISAPPAQMSTALTTMVQRERDRVGAQAGEDHLGMSVLKKMATREIQRMTYSFPETNIKWQVLQLAAHSWSHKKAILALAQARLDDLGLVHALKTIAAVRFHGCSDPSHSAIMRAFRKAVELSKRARRLSLAAPRVDVHPFNECIAILTSGLNQEVPSDES